MEENVDVLQYCLCGAKLNRKGVSETQAYELVSRFRLEHSGRGHEKCSRATWWKVILRRNEARRNRKPDAQRSLFRAA